MQDGKMARPRGCRRLKGLKENLVWRRGEMTIKEQGSERQKMAIDDAFKFLKIVNGKKNRNWKGVPQIKV